MKFKYLFSLILLFSCHDREIIQDECGAMIFIHYYHPIEFEEENRISEKVSKKLRNEFQDSLGKYLADNIIFTVGFEYNLDELNEKHFEDIKNLQWEIPNYYLNYAIEESTTNTTHCLAFGISNKGKILGRKIPKLLEKYHDTKLLTKEEAIKAIKNKLGSDELKKIKFNYGYLNFNRNLKVFEWQFGTNEGVWIEAFENGKIRYGKIYRGILN